MHLAVIHHRDELVVADLGHLSLQQARKQQPVEHHKHEQHDSIIEDQRFFGIFRPFGVVIHVSFVLSSKSLRFRCIFLHHTAQGLHFLLGDTLLQCQRKGFTAVMERFGGSVSFIRQVQVHQTAVVSSRTQ